MGDGLFTYNKQDDRFQQVELEESLLPSDTIYSLLLEDHILWVATSKGLARYDLVKKTLIPFKDKDPSEGEAIFDLRRDKSGGIWLHQTFDLKRIKHGEESVSIHFQLPKIKFHELATYRMKFFVFIGQDERGNIYWVNPLNHHQVFQFMPSLKKVISHTHHFPEKTRYWGWNNYSLFISGILDKGNRLWLGYNQGLLKSKNIHTTFSTFKISNGGFVDFYVEDSNENIWIAGSELWSFSPKNKRNHSISHASSSIFYEYSQLFDSPYGLLFSFIDSKQTLWLSGFGPGCHKIPLTKSKDVLKNHAEGKTAKASSIQAIPMHLPEFAVDGDFNTRWSSEFQDPQWLEVDLQESIEISHLIIHWELCAAKSYKIQFSNDRKSWKTAYTTNQGNGGTETIQLNDYGRYIRMLGTQRDGPYCYAIWELEIYSKPPKPIRYESNPNNPTTLPSNQVFEMLEDHKGTLWFGTQNGLARYIPNKDYFQTVELPHMFETTLQNPRMVQHLFETKDGQILISNEVGNYFIYNQETNTFKEFQPILSESIELKPLGLCYEDSKGDLWFYGTLIDVGSPGVYRYNSSTNKMNYYLEDKYVSSLQEDIQGNLWFGTTQNGLFQFDPQTSSLINYPLKEKLGFPQISCMELDAHGNIWIGTTRGLIHFFPEDGHFDIYKEEDGLFGNDIRNSFKDSQGNLYFGGQGGFSFIDLKNFQLDTTQATIIISDLRIDGRPNRVGQDHSPLSRHIGLTSSIELAHNQSSFSLGFTSIHYNNPQANQYQVMMEGIDDDWQNLGTQRTVNYAGLGAGEYTFKVKGSNANGIWTSEPATLNITILPPWWLSWWAILLYVLIGLAAIWGFIKWRLYSIRLGYERETALAKAEAAEAANEAKSSFLSTVSHELRTPLTSIVGFTEIVKERLEDRVFPLIQSDDKKVNRTIKQASKNLGVVMQEGERLTNLINGLLDLAKIEAGKVEWNMEEVKPAELIARATAATAALFEQKPNLKLITEIPENLPTIIADRDRLIQVLINLISNAVKFTDQGHVKISLEFSVFGSQFLVGSETTQNSEPQTINSKQKTIHNPQLETSNPKPQTVNSKQKTLNSPANTQGGSLTQIVFSIEDTGSGIPTDHLDKVFEKFQQVESQQAGKPKGTGLGLPICKEIVEHHQGKIWVESEVGRGSVFVFSIPIIRAEEHS